jgi:hypothetical protein
VSAPRAANTARQPSPPAASQPLRQAAQLGMAAEESLFEEDCGRTLEQFVFGGELAAAGAFPFLVSFVNQRDGREIGRGHIVLTYIEYRAVSEVFQNIAPHPPSPTSECVLPPAPKARGVGEGQYFGSRQPKDWPLAIISLRARGIEKRLTWSERGLS